MNVLWTDIRSFLRSSRIWAALVMGTLLIIRPIFEVWRYWAGNLNSPMELLSLPLAISDFTPFAPIFCALPYATSFCDDYTSGYMRYITARSGVKTYCKGRTLSVALSGMIVMACIFTITIIVCVLTAQLPDTIQTVSFMEHTIWARMNWLLPYNGLLAYAGRVLLASLFGAVWAVVALGISTWIPNRHVALIAPFVLYQLLWLLLMNSYLNPLFMLRADDRRIPSIWFVVIYQMVWLIIWGTISYQGMMRRCRNE